MNQILNAPPLVMVVDDMATNLLLVTAALTPSYRVLSARSGTAALELLKVEKPELILLDIHMPGMSGHQVLQTLRDDPATLSIPVIFLTTETSQDSEVESLELGADDYVTKPIMAPVLLARVRNVVQRERMKHEQLQSMRDQLAKSAKLESLGKLVASFSHDIGSPIGNCLMTVATVSGKLRELKTCVTTDTLRRSILIECIDAGQEGMSMVVGNLERAADLLDSFKQRALDEATSQLRTILLKPWLDDLLLTLSPMMAGTPHRCQCDVPHDLELLTKPGPLGQVIVNLVNNALVHGFEGQAVGHIKLSATPEGGEIVLVVEDDGKGMSEAVQAQAFEPFFTTKAGQGGTGLGLDIVRHIVTIEFDGRIEMHSQEGQGTRFSIYLPQPAGRR